MNEDSLVEGGRVLVEVVIPLKWSDPDESPAVEEMTRYLDGLRQTVTAVTVVDGSPEPLRSAHRDAWGNLVRLVDPDEVGVDSTCPHECATRAAPNGKVIGAMTGIRLARHNHVVLADDDVRHTHGTLVELVTALKVADLVRPVNVYETWPWQARWDGARTLLNVALGTDWPGTFGLRRSTVVALGGWCPHVLFENLELWRTVEASGARAQSLPEVVVPRRPPGAAQFWSQRVRQAYDDHAKPGRVLVELAILPVTVCVARRAPWGMVVLAVVCVAMAARGRRRLGVEHVPPSVPLWAPAWVLERGVCVWVSLADWLMGGARYNGSRLPLAAHSRRWLKATLAVRRDQAPAGARRKRSSDGNGSSRVAA